MNFRLATQEDLDYMADHSINQRVDRKMSEAIDYIYTLENEESPVGVGGFRMVTPTTAWCWIDLSPAISDNLIIGYRAVRDWIDGFVGQMGIKRLQAFVRSDEPKHIRLVEHLGFEKESLMVGFYDNGDAFMYRKLIK